MVWKVLRWVAAAGEALFALATVVWFGLVVYMVLAFVAGLASADCSHLQDDVSRSTCERGIESPEDARRRDDWSYPAPSEGDEDEAGEDE